jgi:hypothetical protein
MFEDKERTAALRIECKNAASFSALNAYEALLEEMRLHVLKEGRMQTSDWWIQALENQGFTRQESENALFTAEYEAPRDLAQQCLLKYPHCHKKLERNGFNLKEVRLSGKEGAMFVYSHPESVKDLYVYGPQYERAVCFPQYLDENLPENENDSKKPFYFSFGQMKCYQNMLMQLIDSLECGYIGHQKKKEAFFVREADSAARQSSITLPEFLHEFHCTKEKARLILQKMDGIMPIRTLYVDYNGPYSSKQVQTAP